MPAGEIRDIKWLTIAGAPVMAVARNDDRMLFYKANPAVTTSTR